jgi:hypothetical protein
MLCSELTKREPVCVLPEARTAATRVADVMTREVVACRSEEDIRQAEAQLTPP